jgi:dipeptidyl aminopeptidase/acylaminoacyl peptidase
MIIIAALVALPVSWIALRSLRYLHPRRVPVTETQQTAAHLRFPTLLEVTFRTGDGLVLHGWFSRGPIGDVIIFVHGLAGNRWTLFPEAEVLANHGHGILLYDSRASGNSDGGLATWGYRESLDLIGALDFVVRIPELNGHKIGVYGFSVGANTAALVAAGDRRINAVVLASPWTSLLDELRFKFRRWGPLFKLAVWMFQAYGVDVDAVSPIDVVEMIPPRPLLLVSGSLDHDPSPIVLDRLQSTVPNAQLWLVAGAEHGGFASINRQEFESRVAGFFDGALRER